MAFPQKDYTMNFTLLSCKMGRLRLTIVLWFGGLRSYTQCLCRTHRVCARCWKLCYHELNFHTSRWASHSGVHTHTHTLHTCMLPLPAYTYTQILCPHSAIHKNLEAMSSQMVTRGGRFTSHLAHLLNIYCPVRTQKDRERNPPWKSLV